MLVNSNVVKYSSNSCILFILDIVYVDSFHGIQHTSKRTPPFNIVNIRKIGLETWAKMCLSLQDGKPNGMLGQIDSKSFYHEIIWSSPTLYNLTKIFRNN